MSCKKRLHCLSVPHTISNEEFNACAYTMKVVKFCRMMSRRGHIIYHYGNEGAAVDCYEHINILSREYLNNCYNYDSSGNWKGKFFEFGSDDEALIRYNDICSVELLRRIKPGDFVLTFFGISMIRTIQQLPPDVILVEPGIGYDSAFAKYRVYESHSVLAYNQGKINSQHPHITHSVIPNYFDASEFSFNKNSEKKYWVVLGRIIYDKGGDIAYRCALTLGEVIEFAGQGDMSNINVPLLSRGHVNIEERKKLLEEAKGLIIMSRYIEPFGGVSVEALLSGVPVIAANRGAFPEIIENGKNGYLVNTTSQLVDAMRNIGNLSLSGEKIRENAIKKFGLAVVSKKYEKYFDMIDYYNMFGSNTIRSPLLSEFNNGKRKFSYDYMIITDRTFLIDSRMYDNSFLLFSPCVPLLPFVCNPKEDDLGISERNTKLLTLDYFRLDVQTLENYQDLFVIIFDKVNLYCPNSFEDQLTLNSVSCDTLITNLEVNKAKEIAKLFKVYTIKYIN